MSRSGSQVSPTAGRRLDAGNHDRCRREVTALVRMRPASTRRWWRARSGQVMQMAAGPGPEFPDARAGGSGPFDAKALAGRAWLAALPDELAAQRRVMAGLADRCEAWPLVTSLLVGCSLGRAADALSGIDAALGVDTRAARPEPAEWEPGKRWWRRRCRSRVRLPTCYGTGAGPPASGSGGSLPSWPAAPSSTWRSSPRRRSKRAAAAAAPRTSSRCGRHLPAGLPQKRSPGCRPPAAPPTVSAQVGCVPNVVQALGTDSFGAGFGQSSPGMVPGCSAAVPVPVAWLSRRPQDRGHHPSGEEL